MWGHCLLRQTRAAVHMPRQASAPDTAASPPPMLIGSHGALDFLNSVFTPADVPIDLLATGAGLATWLQASGVVPTALAEAVRGLDTTQADALAAESRALRDWFRATLQRWTEGGAAALLPADLEHLNALMARGSQRRRLARSALGLSLTSQDVGADAAAVLAALAWPTYQNAVQRSRRADAVSALSEIVQAQERWRANNPAYQATLTDLPGTRTVSHDGHYSLTLVDGTVTGSSYTARATARSGSPQQYDATCNVMQVVAAAG
ncbi:MAG: hypothetical protein CFE45_10665, partial [Burkholderiales bacterium PBB5]